MRLGEPTRRWLPAVSTTLYVPSMPRSATATAFECSACGWRTSKWVGRCADCEAWGTVTEGRGEDLGRATSRAQLRAAQPATAAVPIGQVDAAAAKAVPTGMSELDRVLGGGLVPGAVVLLAGEPGVGKSTLLLEAGALAASSRRVLYVTGEESVAQVRLRADRIGAISDSLYLAAETDFGALLGHVEAVDPALLIVDSVQTISAAGVDGVPGGVTQVREITAALTALAKQRTLTTVLVGHVTKDGSVAGPRTLEHLVDVVLHFDGDARGQLRMVRALKNRFGPTDEFGCFELGECGLTGLADPSGLFLSERHDPVPGTCVTVTLEGRRPLLAEVQTLVCEVAGDLPPRRVVSGLDSARVGMMLAVLQRRAGLAIGKRDVFAATVGGVRLTEPSVDLAVGLAVASAVADLSVPPDLVAIGEVGLAGEIRRVTGIQRRLIEAERMGFRRAIIPAGSGATADGMQTGSGWAGRGDRAGRGSRAARAGSADRVGQPAHLHLAEQPKAARSQFSGSLLAGSQLTVTEVADMQSAIAAALGRR
jgi:DNA repair protein RadA/Sms